MQGIGYQEARQKRFAEGFTGSNLESKGNEEYLVYFGRAHITDFETGVAARGLMKIGRGKFKTALMRGRNQPGVDFRIYAEIIVATNADTHATERTAETILKNKSVNETQTYCLFWTSATTVLTIPHCANRVYAFNIF